MHLTRSIRQPKVVRVLGMIAFSLLLTACAHPNHHPNGHPSYGHHSDGIHDNGHHKKGEPNHDKHHR